MMVEQIIANKREQHLAAYNEFLEQTDYNFKTVKEIQETTKDDKLQFFKINKKQFEELTASLTDEVLLTKDKSILTDL